PCIFYFRPSRFSLGPIFSHHRSQYALYATSTRREPCRNAGGRVFNDLGLGPERRARGAARARRGTARCRRRWLGPRPPAAEAGLKQYDVLHKIDDQILVNEQQLAVLVRAHKPSEEVKLTVIRDGKPQTLTAKLAEKDLPPLDVLRLGELHDLERLDGLL